MCELFLKIFASLCTLHSLFCWILILRKLWWNWCQGYLHRFIHWMKIIIFCKVKEYYSWNFTLFSNMKQRGGKGVHSLTHIWWHHELFFSKSIKVLWKCSLWSHAIDEPKKFPVENRSLLEDHISTTNRKSSVLLPMTQMKCHSGLSTCLDILSHTIFCAINEHAFIICPDVLSNLAIEIKYALIIYRQDFSIVMWQL